MFYIYVLQNLINDKVYVGQSNHSSRRNWEHRSRLRRGVHRNEHFQSAWNKYGEDSFVYYVLDVCETQQSVDEAENFYISWYMQLDLAYNIELRARGTGATKSEEARKKSSEFMKGNKYGLGKVHSPESRARGVAARKLIQEETSKKVVATRIQRDNYKHSEETKEKLRQANLGKQLSDETKEKIKQTRDEHGPYHISEEHKEKLRKINTGRKLTDESKKKISEAAKNRPMPKFLQDKLVALHSKEFLFKGPDGLIYEGKNIRKFCREHGLFSSGLINVLNGKQKHHKGWTLPT